MFFGWLPRRSAVSDSDTTPPPSDSERKGRRHPHAAAQVKKSKHPINDVRPSRDANKLAPRGRAVSHPASTSHVPTTGAPNPVSSARKTRPSSTPAPKSARSRSMSKSIIDPRLLNDPAFSADPRSNPHHSTSHYSARFSPSVVDGASLPKKHRFHHVEDQGDLDEDTIRQLPNSPQNAPEYRKPARTSYSPSQPASTSLPSLPSLSSTPSTASPSSTASSTPSTPPTHESFPKPMRDPSRPRVTDYSPESQSFPLQARPLIFNHTTPDLRRAVEKPVLPPRPLTTPGNYRIRGETTQGIDNSRNRPTARHDRQLDRIDELDETDPLGVPWHHGGPYEAIYKVTRDRAYHAQLERLNSPNDNPEEKHTSHKVRSSASTHYIMFTTSFRRRVAPVMASSTFLWILSQVRHCRDSRISILVTSSLLIRCSTRLPITIALQRVVPATRCTHFLPKSSLPCFRGRTPPLTNQNLNLHESTVRTILDPMTDMPRHPRS